MSPSMKLITERMNEAAENLEFETAIEHRELLEQRETGGTEAEDHESATEKIRICIGCGRYRIRMQSCSCFLSVMEG